MNNLVVLNGKKNETMPISRAIYLWFLNFFHVHKWKDSEKYNRLNATATGGVVGYVQVQICTECGDRRSQTFGYHGREGQ